MNDGIRSWLEATAGGTLASVVRSAQGASREQYFVEVETPRAEPRLMVLRCEAGSSFSGTDFCPAKEAAIYRALETTPVPVPRVVGLAPEGAALLMERVPGTSDLAVLDEAERDATMLSFIDALAVLHTLDVDALPLEQLCKPRCPEDHARLDLETWASLTEQYVASLDPLLGYAAAWLRAHSPSEVARTVLVQGDTGPGNFVFQQGEVTGIVDWELAHVGDPMDDLAWLDYRNRIGLDRARLHQRYSSRSGIEIDEDSISFYAVAVRYRCAVTTSLAVSRGGGALGLPPYLPARQRFLVDVGRELARCADIREPPVELPRADASERTAWFDWLEGAIRAGAKGIADAELRAATRNSRIVLHYLRAHDQLGPELAALDRADCRASLGSELGGRELLAVASDAGATGDDQVLRYLLRRTQRSGALWAGLHDR